MAGSLSSNLPPQGLEGQAREHGREGQGVDRCRYAFQVRSHPAEVGIAEDEVGEGQEDDGFEPGGRSGRAEHRTEDRFLAAREKGHGGDLEEALQRLVKSSGARKPGFRLTHGLLPARGNSYSSRGSVTDGDPP